MWNAGGAHGLVWGNPKVRYPLQLMDGLPDRACDAICRIHILLMSSENPDSLPDSLPYPSNPSHAALDSAV